MPYSIEDCVREAARIAGRKPATSRVKLPAGSLRGAVRAVRMAVDASGHEHGADGKFTAGHHATKIMKEHGIHPHVQKSDRLDFHDMHVDKIKAMLGKAHRAGGGSGDHATAAMLAKKHLGVDTLHEQKSDRLDFHDVGVAGLRAALEEAHSRGQSGSGRDKRAAAASSKAAKIPEGRRGFETGKRPARPAAKIPEGKRGFRQMSTDASGHEHGADGRFGTKSGNKTTRDGRRVHREATKYLSPERKKKADSLHEGGWTTHHEKSGVSFSHPRLLEGGKMELSEAHAAHAAHVSRQEGGRANMRVGEPSHHGEDRVRALHDTMQKHGWRKAPEGGEWHRNGTDYVHFNRVGSVNISKNGWSHSGRYDGGVKGGKGHKALSDHLKSL